MTTRPSRSLLLLLLAPLLVSSARAAAEKAAPAAGALQEIRHEGLLVRIDRLEGFAPEASSAEQLKNVHMEQVKVEKVWAWRDASDGTLVALQVMQGPWRQSVVEAVVDGVIKGSTAKIAGKTTKREVRWSGGAREAALGIALENGLHLLWRALPSDASEAPARLVVLQAIGPDPERLATLLGKFEVAGDAAPAGKAGGAKAR